jgi:glycosyltransferase involved in cell wall biosynthesis
MCKQEIAAFGAKTLYINGRFLSQPITGVQRYARELLREFDTLFAKYESGVRVVVLVPRNVEHIPTYRHLTVRTVGVLTGHKWEQFELPFYSFRGTLFTPGGGAPLIHPRNVITIHDAAVCAAPAGFSFSFRKWYTFLYRMLCRTSVHVLTVSNFSKGELVRWYGAKPEKVTVTYEGCEHAKATPANNRILREHNLQRYNYLLAVSTKHPNKNFDGIVNALKHLNMPWLEVAIAGKTLNHIYKQVILQTSSVKELGYVTDGELRSLYENAACFVFPSFYEGFGLPALEALSLGCPAVVANTASMPELFTGMAFLCDPHDPKDIAAKIHDALGIQQDRLVRNSISAAVSKYSWSVCAQLTWGVLMRAMNKGAVR